MSALAVPTFDSVSTALHDLYAELDDRVTIDPDNGHFELGDPGVPLDDLAHFVATLLGDDEFIPSWIPAGLQLERLELRRSDVGPFDLVFKVAANGIDWTPFDGFVLEDATIEIGYGATGVWGRVSASSHIDEIELDVSLELPDELVVAHVHSVDDARHFLERNELVAPPGSGRKGASTPRLVDLSLNGSIRTGTFVLHVEVADILDVAPFHLDTIAFDLRLGNSTEATLWADLVLDTAAGEITIDTFGRVDGTGWSFEGRVDFEQPPTLGTLRDDLVSAFATGPLPLPDMVANVQVESLTVGLDTSTHDVSFDCRLRWDGGVDVEIALRYTDGAFTAGGTLTIGDLRFELQFSKDGSQTMLLGAFSADGGLHVTLADVLSALGGDTNELLEDLASDFSFGLLDATLAYESGSRMLFAADMDLGVDLSGLGSLPLVGSMIPPDEALRLTFRPILSTTGFDVAPVNQALGPGVADLPDVSAGGSRIDAQLRLGTDDPIDLTVVNVPADDSTKDEVGTTTLTPGTTASSTAKADANPFQTDWHEVDRTFGPVAISRVGVHFDQSTKEIELLLSGSISIAGLELSLTGLGAKYGLDDQRLEVTLHGIGLDLRRDPIEIAGAFVNIAGDFAGKVTIRTSEFSIAALGAFKMISGSPSMFVYGLLDYPLGGPPFFYVEGLAAGVGYNRRFIPPKIDAVREFPLVTDAAGSTSAPVTVEDQLTRLHDAVPPALGEYFLAVGVKFTSFKLLESFVLLVVTFGEHVEIDLIGTSTYQTPPGDLGGLPAMARVDLDLVGRIRPDDGEIMVQAQLSPTSYVYNPMCHISGGFAFASWFKGDYEGDFVLSVGGYHPRFVPPPHYPVPPRIAVKYQVNPEVYVKGDGYFALTPSCFMAGASVEAHAAVESASASFAMSIDFLIGWEPYHYDAELSVDVAAAWHCFHTHAHVDLHIMGPTFAGHGTVQWTIFSFDVSFGDSTSHGPIPIGFDRFRDGFLPAAESACSVRVASGLIDSLENVLVEIAPNTDPVAVTVWNINPKELRIETTSIIPSGSGLGIAPMNRGVLANTDQTVVVTRDGVTVPADKLTVEALPAKQFPSALWGTSIHRSVADRSVAAFPGHRITPAAPVKAHRTHPIPRKLLVVDPDPVDRNANDDGWSVGHVFVEPSGMSAGWTDPEDNPPNGDRRFAGLPWTKIQVVASTGGFG